MNCLKQDKIKSLEINISNKGKKQDTPNLDLNNQDENENIKLHTIGNILL